ncbi:hypothetical protein N7468_003427 [Penicillium chermesinum]|uniref:C6 transcription factor n=1 Tax=Penicillium chermesinum TaxID=63820 RepID=A0A9W9TS89_9EURO|nr:uncharacterized protein N7468_003427 [Penicillium chermesinum]KAJ5238808.1 hypothetical protein N7468_003427 [Penicillium chermesinum]
MELGLLGHYLTHTSHSIPCDKLDLYALSVGMPNLAFTSKPVMSSLIALAAACKSHDLVTGTRTPLDGPVLAQVRDLLRLAEHHHRASLQHIQAYISQSDWYDTILANAALMVLYASANHSTRVHLAITAKRASRQLPSDVLPQNSQWISFTRAAHIASSAVLRDIVDAADYFPTPMSSSTSSAQGLPLDAWNDSRVLSPELGPSERTKSLFLPLVASTYVRAHETLRKRADSIAARFKEAESLQDHLDVGACLEALPLLEACATATLSRTEPQDTPENEKPESVVFDDSCKVSSWVGKYMISVTSMTLPTVLRRTIMSYLNKAPSDFLNIIQSVLDLPAAEGTVDHLSPRYENMALLTPTQLLAVDIFAHWLVLLLLLDGVWWIGRIGQWELGQVVSLIKNQDLLPQLADPDSDETWWPQSMYFVNLELLAGV